MPPHPHFIVTLVHGTILFARWPGANRILQRLSGVRSRPAAKPLWYHAGSQFATALKAALGEERTEIRSFYWTGGNTVWDRLAGAGAFGDPASAESAAARAGMRPTLRQHVAEIAATHPTATQVLVGHSHGGSVCQAALRDEKTRRNVKAFVSLSTPYVHMRERWDSKNLETGLRVLGFLLYVAALMTTMWWLEPRVGEFWNAALVAVAMLSAIVLWERVLRHRQVRIDTVRAWARSVNEEEVDVPARLIVISDGDEALLALKIAEALSAISRGLWRSAYGIVEFVERAVVASRRRAWVVYIGVAVAFLIFILRYDVNSPWGPVAGVQWTFWFPVKSTFYAFIAPAILFLVVGLALFVPTLAALLLGFPALVFFRWLAFGWGGTAGGDVTAESLPLGRVTAVRLPAPKDGRGLRHSELYNDPRVPPRIAEFVLRTVGEKPDARPAAGFSAPDV
jgi:hypothetical protein